MLKTTDFAEALVIWNNVKPCLMVVDWNIPDGYSVEFVRRVRASDTASAIVMITPNLTTE